MKKEALQMESKPRPVPVQLDLKFDNIPDDIKQRAAADVMTMIQNIFNETK